MSEPVKSCRRNLSPERRKVVVLSASLAAMSGLVGLVQQKHPMMVWVWLFVMLTMMGYVVRQLVKIRKQERSARKGAARQ